MTRALEMEWSCSAAQGAFSRRALLQAGMAASVAASGLGRAAGALAGPAITPFSYQAPQSALDDLRQRLARARWPERETVHDWSQGVPLEELQALVGYWRTDYDWRRFEARLNGFEQYRTPIDGLDIHFLHVRSPHADALPVVITHGWPGSIIEFLEIIEPLTDPTAHGGEAQDAFHVVAPSLPGFGFSGKPAGPGWNSARIARAWAELMGRLGYTRYVAQGGDWGAEVTTRMAQQRAPGLAAIHLNFPLVFPDPLPTSGLSAEEQRAVDAMARFQSDGFGYFLQQSTRPQTVGYALVDSPAGQAAWIYEKFYAWTDHDGELEDALSRDAMLDNITLYWLTGTAASSARIYFENAQVGVNSGTIDHVPVGCSLFPGEIFPTPRSWPSSSMPICSIGTSSIAAATSRPSRSRRCSRRSCATAFAPCADGRAGTVRRDVMTDTQTELSPRFAEGDPMRVIGLAERYDAVTMNRIPEQWAHFQQRIGDVRGRIDPAQFGICYQLSKSPLVFEYLTAVMVGDDAPLPAGFVERRLPARRHAVFTHRGHPSGLRPLMGAIFRDWLPRSGHKTAGNPDFVEVYGEAFDPVRLEGVIEIWVPLEE